MQVPGAAARALRARLDHAVTDYGAAPEGSFEFGLRAILDGLEARLAC